MSESATAEERAKKTYRLCVHGVPYDTAYSNNYVVWRAFDSFKGHVFRLETELDKRDKTLKELEAWKAEATKVFDALNLQEIGRELQIPLGEEIAPQVLPGIRKLRESLGLRARLNRDVTFTFDRSLGGKDAS